MLIGRRHAGAGVHHEQHQVGHLDGRFRRSAHAAIQRFRIAFLQPGGVDQPHGSAAQQGLALLAVAGHAWGIRNDRLPPAHQLVEQRGFSDIRPAGDNNDREMGLGQRRATSLPSSVTMKTVPMATDGATETAPDSFCSPSTSPV